MSATTTPTSEFFDAMRTCAEVERFFRLQRHTVLNAARAGLIPSARRSRCGREAFLIDPRDAYKYWGPK